MAISFELNEITDPEIKQRVESVIRNCIDECANDEVWKIWIHASGLFCQVKIEGPAPTRERFFFEGIRNLPEEINAWITAYPIRFNRNHCST